MLFQLKLQNDITTKTKQHTGQSFRTIKTWNLEQNISIIRWVVDKNKQELMYKQNIALTIQVFNLKSSVNLCINFMESEKQWNLIYNNWMKHYLFEKGAL